MTFDKSVKMVTYLAWYCNFSNTKFFIILINVFYVIHSFIVCDFQDRNRTTEGGVPVRAISRADQFESTHYPLDMGVKITDYYEEYFGIKYALPKQGDFKLISFKI